MDGPLRAGLVLLALASACRTRPLDAGARADAGAPTDASRCAIHDRVPVALTRLERVDPTPLIPQALRVRIAFPYRRTCDLPGDVAVELLPGGGCPGCASIAITAHLWRSSDDACGGAAIEATRVLVLSDVPGAGGAAAVTVRDGASAGTLMLALPVGGPAAPDCTPAALGQDCARDCQCEAASPSARCVPVRRGVPTAAVCAVSCDEDADCPDAAPGCGLGTSDPPFSCVAMSACSGTTCPFGQSCAAVGGEPACRPPTVEHQLPQACSCSTDCGPDAICTLVGANTLGCIAPCATAADCPGVRGCGGLLCTDGACLGRMTCSPL